MRKANYSRREITLLGAGLLRSFSGSKAGDEREVLGVRLCWCPPGSFRMGSPLDEPDRRPDETPVNVTISRGFWAGKYEVTQGQWRRFAGEFPQPPTAGDGPNLPVCWVSFIEAETFARKLTERAHAAGELPALWEFRLPTEAQWEYACRAGTVTAFAFGNTIGSKQANILEGPALKHMTEVGKYPPNSWGLHDTHGNTFEWCRDWYHASLPGGVDPDLSTVQGVPNRDGTYSRVRRGGAYNDEPKFCRSAFRLRYEPERRSDHIGFRVVAVQA